MESRRRLLVRLSAALAAGDPRRLEEVLQRCSLEADPNEVEEAILQSYLFLGYPAALNALGLWREVSARKAGPGAHDPPGSWGERGERVCQIVYGGQYERLRENVRAIHPDMERWMVVEGYGKVIGRPGLSLPTRELCIVALLAVLGAPRQLYSHLRGALNAGAPMEGVEAALGEAGVFQDQEGRRTAREVWKRVLARNREPGPGELLRGPGG
jgi:4-carboxymuconolactone decarboxylase